MVNAMMMLGCAFSPNNNLSYLSSKYGRRWGPTISQALGAEKNENQASHIYSLKSLVLLHIRYGVFEDLTVPGVERSPPTVRKPTISETKLVISIFRKSACYDVGCLKKEIIIQRNDRVRKRRTKSTILLSSSAVVTVRTLNTSVCMLSVQDPPSVILIYGTLSLSNGKSKKHFESQQCSA